MSKPSTSTLANVSEGKTCFYEKIRNCETSLSCSQLWKMFLSLMYYGGFYSMSRVRDAGHRLHRPSVCLEPMASLNFTRKPILWFTANK